MIPRRAFAAVMLAVSLLLAAMAGQATAQTEAGEEAGPPPEKVIASIEQAGDKANQISQMGTVGGVDLVVVDTLSGDEASREIENAVSLNEYEVRNLQSALEKKPEVSAKLQNDGVEVRNVVAAEVENDRVVLYVRKQ